MIQHTRSTAPEGTEKQQLSQGYIFSRSFWWKRWIPLVPAVPGLMLPIIGHMCRTVLQGHTRSTLCLDVVGHVKKISVNHAARFRPSRVRTWGSWDTNSRRYDSIENGLSLSPPAVLPGTLAESPSVRIKVQLCPWQRSVLLLGRLCLVSIHLGASIKQD